MIRDSSEEVNWHGRIEGVDTGLGSGVTGVTVTLALVVCELTSDKESQYVFSGDIELIHNNI